MEQAMKEKMGQLANQITVCDRTKPYVYIAYSTRDGLSVYETILFLQQQGINLWIDVPVNFNTGEGYNTTIFGALADENCRGILFFMSEESMVSAQTAKEIAYRDAQAVRASHAMRLPVAVIELLDIEHHDIGVWVEGYFYQTYHESPLSPAECERIEKYRRKYNNKLDHCSTKYCLAKAIYHYIDEDELARVDYAEEGGQNEEILRVAQRMLA